MEQHHHIQDIEAGIDAPIPVSKQTKRNRILAGCAGIMLVIASIVMLNISNTQTQGVGQYRNWSADAIVQGGAITEKELLEKYDTNASGVQNIFQHYGISRSDLTSKMEHGVVYQDGTVKVNGKTVATAAYSVSRTPFNDKHGNKPRTITTSNGTTLYEGPNMSIFVRPVDAFIIYRNGVFHRAIISSCLNPVVAVPEKPEPQPEPATFACTNLVADKINRTRYRFTASATAQNTEIVSYTFTFNDGSKPETTGNVVEHTFTPGKHTIKVAANARVNGVLESRSSKDCEVVITVAEEPKAPIATCDRLTARAIIEAERTYEYTLDYTAESGAVLTKVVYAFGDGTTKEFAPNNAKTVTHQFAQPGTFTTITTLHFNVTVDGKTSQQRAECTTTIVVPKPDNCPLPGKEDLPKNSPECVEPPIETPPELPQTGLSEWLAGGIGLAALAAALYYYNMSQKNLKEKMLKK